MPTTYSPQVPNWFGQGTPSSAGNKRSGGYGSADMGIGIPVRQGDRIFLQTKNSLASQVLQVIGRFVKTDGTLLTVKLNTKALGTTRAVQSWDASAGNNGGLSGYITEDCLLIGMSVSYDPTSAAGGVRGQTYVQFGLGVGNDFILLGQDYITAFYAPAYPNARQLVDTEQNGFIKTFSVSNPSAGADWSATVPTGAKWRIRSVRMIVNTASATARTIGITWTDGTNTLGTITVSTQQGASLIVNYLFANINNAGLNVTVTSAGSVVFGLPADLILPAGFTIGASTSISGTDTETGIFLEIEEWLE